MTIQSIISYQENMEMCSCGSDERVMFHCEDQACHLYKQQKLYCHECMIPDRHAHLPVLIAKTSKNVTDEWNKLRQDINKIRQSCSQWMQAHGPLVQFLDSYLTIPKNTLDLKLIELHSLNTSIERIFQQYVAEISSKGDILKLQQLNPRLKEFKEQLEALEFLKNMGPAVLWKIFSEILHLVSHQHIPEKLSHASLEVLLRLKLYKAQVLLNEVHRSQQLPECNTLEYLVNPELHLKLIISSLNHQLQTLTENISASGTDAMKIDSVRSELDAVSVTLMFKAFKSEVLENQQASNAKFADVEKNYKLVLDRLAVLELKLSSAQEEVKEQQQLIAESKLTERKRILDSLIIDDEEKFNKIQSFLVQAGRHQRQLRLVYRGSLNSFEASVFHENCDFKTNTLTIVKTVEGKIFGGFIKKNWKGDGLYKSDPNSWLFNIDAPNIFQVKLGGEKAIGATQLHGPIFGGGHDLFISDDCNTNCDSYVNGHSFMYSGGVSNLLLTQGKVKFKVLEIEVYLA
ncbi:hypothetical protein FGO68_gene7221 [Halteria grandinella]|uniref:TLDc domain-containing protein n=1 Tax=Halteria grandinella TaxID=5974 RepID=A0A8J8T2F8_HALGN|nr:hypothetical protein FGO68_gene7221 [Halteria grandinella]